MLISAVITTVMKTADQINGGKMRMYMKTSVPQCFYNAALFQPLPTY